MYSTNGDKQPGDREPSWIIHRGNVLRRNKLVQRFLFFFVIGLIMLPTKTPAYPFLTKSQILKAKGIRIFVGENQNDAIVFEKEVMEKNGIPKDGSNTFLITSNGLYPLEGMTEERNLVQACGDPYPGIGFKKNGQNGFLISTGINIAGVLKWNPAKVLPKQKPPSCLKKLTKMDNASYSAYASEGLNGVIHQISWRRKLTEVDFINYCKNMAAWNAKIQKDRSYSELYTKCIEQKWYCDYEDRLIVSIQDERQRCQEITNTILDCDGRASVGKDLHNFLGVLKIRSGSKKEVWLLWNAPGYEGEGIYTIEINDIGKKRNQVKNGWFIPVAKPIKRCHNKRIVILTFEP